MAARRAQRWAVFLFGALLGVGLWQAYGMLLSGVR
jgi:hypothetical protein